MFGLEKSCIIELPEEYYTMEDYGSSVARWCPGCGDHPILTAVQRLCRDEQLPPEKTVSVSGIGCSSRFPHYMGTYGFHGLHGRALPVAEGICIRRPDLNIFVNMGDGDCCSIGAGHWLHAIRYNMRMVAMLHDNRIYALTKKQTSPTSRKGDTSNTQPHGAYLMPLDPIMVTLGMTNASFVAQVVEWIPELLYAVLKEGFHHNGFAFIRILQRCPAYLPNMFSEFISDPSKLLLINPENLSLSDGTKKILKTQIEYNEKDILKAKEVAGDEEKIPVGILYRNEDLPCYNDLRKPSRVFTAELKEKAFNKELDKFAI